MPKINLANTNDSEVTIDPVPPGFYNAVVESAEFTAGEKDHIGLVFNVTEGEHVGRRVRQWYYLHTKDTKRISLQQLRTLGTPANFNPANAAQLAGKKARIETELSQDGKFANVRRIYQTSIDAGSYDSVIESVERDSRDEKNFLRVIYRITQEGQFQNLRLTDNLYTHEKAIGFTANRLKRIGASMDEFDTDNNTHLNSLVGNNVKVSVIPHKSSDGKEFTRITSVKLLQDASGLRGISPEAVEVAEEFDAGFEDEDRF